MTKLKFSSKLRKHFHTQEDSADVKVRIVTSVALVDLEELDVFLTPDHRQLIILAPHLHVVSVVEIGDGFV